MTEENPEEEGEEGEEENKAFSPSLRSPIPPDGSLPPSPPGDPPTDLPRLSSRGHTPTFDHSQCSTTMHRTCVCVNFIAEHTRAKEDATKVIK